MKKLTKKILFTSSTLVGVGALVGYLGYSMYDFSSKQGENRFVTPKHTTINQFFQPEDNHSKPLVRDEYIAGQKGYVVNNGPVRITTAYKSLFDKQSLMDLSDWVYKNVSWGANAVSLKNVTFTTGVDKTDEGTTKGFHTAGRTGSAIFISPDAFEDLGSLGDDVFQKYTSPLINDYKQQGVDAAEKSAKNSSLDPNIGTSLTQFLAQQFTGQASVVSHTGTYKELQANDVKNVYKEIVSDAWSDDYISKINGSQLATIAQSTELGNLNFTNPERISYLRNNGKMDQALEKYKTRLAFNSAYKLLVQSTGGTQGLGNTYLSLALKNIIFKEGAAKDSNGTPIMYTLRPRADWDKYSGVSATVPEFKNPKQALLVDGLKSGYFKHLNDDLQIAGNAVNLRIGIYQLFLKYFDNAINYLNTSDSPFNVVKKMWSDDRVIAANTWINEVRTYGSSDRVRWILSGEFPTKSPLNVLYEDEWMLNKEDKIYIDSLDKTNVLDRQVQVGSLNIYKAALQNPAPKSSSIDPLNGKSISSYYRDLMINSMKYTISHEYGHHETMWSTYGVYGQAEDSADTVGNFQDTINLYSDEKAAAGEDYISREAFDYLRDIAGGEYDKATKQTSPVEEQGVRNAMDIIMRSGDKLSSTWTPSYFSHEYKGYKPGIGWTHSSEDLTQPKLLFKTDANGVPKISLGDTERIGSTPITFNTNGVDSQGNRNQSNYLFAIDKSLLSNDNPAKNDTNRIDKFLRLMITPAELLYGYQTSQWLLDGHKNGDAWSIQNDIALPSIDTSGLKKATSQYSAILAQDPSDKKSKMMTLIGIMRMQFGLQDSYAQEIITQLDAQVEALYTSLKAKYKNLFEDTTTGLKKMNGYDRSLAIFNTIIDNTRATIKAGAANVDPYETLKAKPGIYYDPKAISYIQLPEGHLESSDIDRIFQDNANSHLVKEGTVVLGAPQKAFADYTGNFPEFMTRVVNQLTFRPDYNAYKDANGKIDAAEMVKANEGWFDDMNRFDSLGLNMYNMTGKDSSLTKVGAKLLNWYRDILGLHVENNKNITMKPDGKVDYDALDSSIAYADPLTRIYRNVKTNLTTAWGWIPKDKQDVYKNIILVDKVTRKQVKVPIITKHTSNYFYREDMDNDDSKIHSFTNGYVQWVADWQAAGSYSNADISSGKYDFFFEGKDGIKVDPFNSWSKARRKNAGDAKHKNNNGYPGVLSEINYIIDAENNKIEIDVK